MYIACLDLESTLMPEVWLALAEETGIDELKITTREEPDVDALMDYRIKILKDNNIKLEDLQSVVSKLEPLEGANEFIDWLESTIPLIILTDALWPTIQPMLHKIGNPTTLSHDLEIDDEGFIEAPLIRLDDQKTKTIMMLKNLNYKTIAIGDSFNDLGMLRFADLGVIFNGSHEIKEAMPEIKAVDKYDELKLIIENLIAD